MHRIRRTKLSPTQISERLPLAAPRGPTSASPLSDVLTGTSLKINTDTGAVLSYTFKGAETSSHWRRGMREWKRADALTLNEVARSSLTWFLEPKGLQHHPGSGQ
jgi:hypothetical protein